MIPPTNGANGVLRLVAYVSQIGYQCFLADLCHSTTGNCYVSPLICIEGMVGMIILKIDVLMSRSSDDTLFSLLYPTVLFKHILQLSITRLNYFLK